MYLVSRDISPYPMLSPNALEADGMQCTFCILNACGRSSGKSLLQAPTPGGNGHGCGDDHDGEGLGLGNGQEGPGRRELPHSGAYASIPNLRIRGTLTEHRSNMRYRYSYVYPKHQEVYASC